MTCLHQQPQYFPELVSREGAASSVPAWFLCVLNLACVVSLLISFNCLVLRTTKSSSNTLYHFVNLWRLPGSQINVINIWWALLFLRSANQIQAVVQYTLFFSSVSWRLGQFLWHVFHVITVNMESWPKWKCKLRFLWVFDSPHFMNGLRLNLDFLFLPANQYMVSFDVFFCFETLLLTDPLNNELRANLKGQSQ